MELHNEPKDNMDSWMEEHETRRKRGKIASGIFLVGLGSLVLAKQMGVIFPEWLLSWPTIVTSIALLFGARRGFSAGPWLIVLAVGVVGFISKFNPQLHMENYIWPIVIIGAGLMMIFKKSDGFAARRRFKKKFMEGGYVRPSSEEQLDIVSIFSGAKKNVITKDFKGGDVTCVFGGAEVNMSQSDFTGSITLDSTQIFGGVKYLIPAHWTVHSEVTCIFGGVEDNRPMTNTPPDPNKTLFLKGTCMFGGIEISSY